MMHTQFELEQQRAKYEELKQGYLDRITNMQKLAEEVSNGLTAVNDTPSKERVDIYIKSLDSAYKAVDNHWSTRHAVDEGERNLLTMGLNAIDESLNAFKVQLSSRATPH